MMLQDIRHIIFDLGGVLLNIDYVKTERAFIQLGLTDFAEKYSQFKQTFLFDDFEMGRISSAEFIRTLGSMFSSPVSDQQIVDAWNAMLLDFPLRRFQLLQQLSLHYDLVLLSNTNEIHEKAFTELIWSDHRQLLPTFFDKVYYSHRVGLRKPDKNLFKRILEENNFNACQTLFIDDSPQHIEAATSLGIHALFLRSGMTIEKDVFRPVA